MRPPLNRLSATQLVRLVASREVNCEAITHSFLDAVEQRERDVHAFTWIDPGRALSIARDYDRAGDPGVLAGLPIAVKDVIDTAGIATEYGSPIYAGRVPRADAASVAATRRGGFRQDRDRGARQFHTWRDPQPARAGTHAGRVVERFGRRSCRAYDTVCTGNTDRRVGDPAGCVLRSRRFRARHVEPLHAGVKQVSDTLDVVGCFANSVEDAALLASTTRCEPNGARRVPTPLRRSSADYMRPLRSSPAMADALDIAVRACADRGAVVREIGPTSLPRSQKRSASSRCSKRRERLPSSSSRIAINCRRRWSR